MPSARRVHLDPLGLRHQGVGGVHSICRALLTLFVALQRKVFDGLIPHTGSNARGSFNHRFAQPSRAVDASYFYPGDQFPFSDVMQTDPVTGVEDSLLARVSPETTPMIFYTNTSTEYWRLPTALIHTTVDGKTDVPPADTSRI